MFSEFVSQLSNAPESEWIASFISLVRSVESSGSSGKVPTKRDISQVFSLVESKLRTISGGSEELVSVLLDALRVLLRFRENVEASLTAQLMSHLLNISENSAVECVDNAQLAARCLINYLFENAQNTVVFLSVEVDGLSRIGRILNRHCEWCNARTEEMTSLHYFLVRVVHMMVSQNDTVRALLAPTSELTSPLVMALVRRLSNTGTTSGGGGSGGSGGDGSCSGGVCGSGSISGSGGGIGSSGGSSGGTTISTFPYGECNGKLYLEIGRLLFALECHEVLKTHITSGGKVTSRSTVSSSSGTGSSGSGTSSGGTGAGSGTGTSSDIASVSTETNPLSRLLIVTVLSAILSSTTPYTTTTTTNTSTTTANNTTNTPTTTTTLTTLQQQCQDVSIQLAMYLPARSYHDTSVVSELSVLMSSNSGGSGSTSTGTSGGAGTSSGGSTSTGGESKGGSKGDNSNTTNTAHEPAIVVQIVPYLLSILHRQLLQAHGESTDTNNSSSGGSSGTGGVSGGVGGSGGGTGSGGSGTAGSGSGSGVGSGVGSGGGTSGGGSGGSSDSGSSASGSGSGSGGSGCGSGGSGSVKSVKAGAAMKPSEQSALLTPILVLLTKLCTHSLTARTTTKSVIFPTIFHPTSSTHLTRAGTAKMDPTDVPCGTFRYYLVGLMTSLDSQLKRCVAELVYVLCDEDADEFTARTGFGNAVALLQLKGLC